MLFYITDIIFSFVRLKLTLPTIFSFSFYNDDNLNLVYCIKRTVWYAQLHITEPSPR